MHGVCQLRKMIEICAATLNSLPSQGLKVAKNVLGIGDQQQYSQLMHNKQAAYECF
jgi:hypothetical protein